MKIRITFTKGAAFESQTQCKSRICIDEAREQYEKMWLIFPMTIAREKEFIFSDFCFAHLVSESRNFRKCKSLM